MILVADSGAHDKNKLKANVKNSNETLAVLTANEVNISYWKSVTPFTLPLASHKNLNSLLLRSIMISCGDYPKIEYDTAKWDLDSEDKKELDGLVKMLKNKKNIGIQVDGHTDSVGANFRNDILGIRRAKGVAAYLNSKGIKTAAASYGEVKPLCTTETEDCKQLNRRSHLYPVLLSPKSSKFPSKMGNFYLAKIDGDTATYSFIPTSSKHFGSVIGNMFNKKDQANVFHTVGHRNISLDADGNNSAGDHIRKFEPVYLKARSN